ncbi:hypothetical protein PHLCEN_2v12912 [Hermanssonia centrifuga]|uniref:Uncharacterized protein n=1 Tax=Hermanssonia centrifuga TaxID=98765 RepID=A0A2R6NG73_9APHY|nr:hypothetical protein PHLCEN_2v12912 [Hermanssonia centrifuga]
MNPIDTSYFMIVADNGQYSISIQSSTELATEENSIKAAALLMHLVIFFGVRFLRNATQYLMSLLSPSVLGEATFWGLLTSMCCADDEFYTSFNGLSAIVCCIMLHPDILETLRQWAVHIISSNVRKEGSGSLRHTTRTAASSLPSTPLATEAM